MSTKFKSLYLCNHCGYQSSKWLGKCPNCDQWNTFVEEVITKKNEKITKNKKLPDLKLLNQISTEKTSRIKSELSEFDRLLGAGIVPGSVILMSGEPGIGKSTLLLQLAALFSQKGKVIYVSGEESEEQIKLRADRLTINYKDLYILTETDAESIYHSIKNIQPIFTIIDSIQTMNLQHLDNLTGTLTQIKECANLFIDCAKKENTCIVLVGHVTKEGTIAGPKILEHMVDVVLHMEGDRNLEFRILKSNKNRFGSTFEMALFEMGSEGLKQVINPSLYFLEQSNKNLSGSVIVSIMEGTRPLLIELQALVSPTNMPYPRRVAEGVDYNKILLITAILEKILGVKLNNQEIYIKIVGGIKIQEPSIDLGIAMAIMSSYKNKALDNLAVMGEIGLTGEIRPVPYMEQRLNEIQKLGIKKVYIPKTNKKRLSKQYENLVIQDIEYINEIYKIF